MIRFTWFTVLFLAILTPIIVSAQSVPLEEIVVTATRRETQLMDTPISITALDGQSLDSLAVSSAHTLAGFVPNLTVSYVSDSTVVNIRGIEGNNFSAIGDPTVAFHVDGIYSARPRGAELTFFDIERVEVLRGPQGMLYGRNATAGSINVISRRPTDEFDASIDVLAGNESRVNSRGMINIPVSDNWAVRAAYIIDDRDGYNKHPNGFEGSDDSDRYGIRLQSLFQISDNASFLIGGDYEEEDGVGPQTSLAFNRDPREFVVNSQPFRQTKKYGIRGELVWELDTFTVTWLPSFRVDERIHLNDLDEGLGPSHFIADQESEQLSQEVRLTSNESRSDWDWLVGFYYFEEDVEDTRDILFDGVLIRPPDGVIDTFNFNAFRNPNAVTESVAVFANVDRQFTEQLEVVLGARYTDDSRESGRVSTAQLVLPNGMLGRLVRNFRNTFSVASDNFDFKVGLNFRPADGSLYYANVTTGYKQGGFNDDGTLYTPEEITAFELGLKQSLLDDRLQLSAAAFFQDYTDLQVFKIEAGPGGAPQSFIRNAAEAEISGLELEGLWAPIDPLRFNFSLGLLETEYKDFISAVNNRRPPPRLLQFDLSGNELTNAPAVNLNVGAEYTFELGQMGSLAAGINVLYEDEAFLDEFNVEREKKDSFTKTDIRLVYTGPNQRFWAQAYVDNIEDEDVRRSLASLPPAGNRYQYAPPRTYGLRIGYRTR